MHEPSPPILQVEQLAIHFVSERGVVRAVDGVDLDVRPGEVLCVVGESGSGKSMTALAVMRLLPEQARQVAGQIRFRGRSLAGLSREELRRLRGKEIAMIFQDPRVGFDPLYTVGYQVMQGLRVHHPEVGRRAARARAAELFARVGIPAPEQRLDDYPHQYSGGMLQRAMIAMALSCEPGLLVADEPTSSLDVTIQAQILDLMRRMQETTGTALVMITHDMGVVAEMADRVVVMYAGQVVERGTVRQVLQSPRHPYTVGLLQSVPRIFARQRLVPIPDAPPGQATPTAGCRFAPRCRQARPACREAEPELTAVQPGHWVKCVEGV